MINKQLSQYCNKNIMNRLICMQYQYTSIDNIAKDISRIRLTHLHLNTILYVKYTLNKRYGNLFSISKRNFYYSLKYCSQQIPDLQLISKNRDDLKLER